MSVKHPLSTLFDPATVCLVGASEDANKVTGRPLVYLQQHDYPGDVYVVNPNRDSVRGLNSYPTVRSVPADIDVALVMVPARGVGAALQDCADAGVKNAVILSSGFEETSDGAEAVAAVEAVRSQGRLNIVGPNCEGIWSLPSKLVLTLGSIAGREDLKRGPVAVISQSGSIGAGLIRNLQDLAIGCEYFISTGNETHLGTVDFLEYLIAEGPHLAVVLLFIESLKDGQNLCRVARMAAERGTTLVALKAGQSAEGKRATATHTGKVASESAVYSDVFHQAGIVEVESLNGFLRATQALLGRPPRESGLEEGGVGVLGLSGGSRALIVDAAVSEKVPLARFAAGTEATLAQMIPSYGVASNPTDITAQVLGRPELFETALDAVAGDPATEALLVQFGNTGASDVTAMADLLARVGVEHRKPVVASMLGDDCDKAVRGELFERGIHCASGPDEAVRLLSWAYQGARPRVTAASGVEPRPDFAAGASKSGTGEATLATWEGQVQFLRSCGVSVPRWTLLQDDEEPRLGTEVSFPVAVKALPTAVQHKAEIGAVRVGIRSEEELRRAVKDLRRLGVSSGGLLVQEMVPDGVEMLVTVREDADFGPIVSVGSGGHLVEWLKDVVHVSIPCPRPELMGALERLRVMELLRGYRNASPRDIPALLDVVNSMAAAYLDMDPRPKEIEINPLFVLPEGQGTWAVDALVV